MKHYRSQISKLFILALISVILAPSTNIQNSKTDSLARTEQLNSSSTKPATVRKAKKNKPTVNTPSRKDTLDLSRCFENGLLYKQNPLSNI